MSCREMERHTVTEIETMLATHARNEAAQLRSLLAIISASANASQGSKPAANSLTKIDSQLKAASR